MIQLGAIIGRYEVERQLGAGGMATVYAVRHTELGSLHALKLLLVNRPGLAARLLDEGKLQAGLRHPHIVAMHDVVDVEGQPGLVMELVEGMALDEWIEVHPDAADDVKLELARQVISAVGYAHEQGLIHRDLKPANVLVTDVGGRPFAKVADFGLAKFLDDDVSRTKTGVPMGTPRYMAPEQIKDAKHVDARADIFALGCVLHELWTGTPAFAAESLPELFMDIVAGQMPSLDGLPDVIASAVGGALISDRDQRIQTCAELLEILAGERAAPVALASSAEAAKPALWVAGLGAMSLTGIAVALVLALLCGALGLWWGSSGAGQGTPIDIGLPSTPRPVPEPGVRPRPSPRPVSPAPAPSPRPQPSPQPAPTPSPKPKPDKDKDKGKGKGPK